MPAAQMADRILVALGEILGEPEVVGRVEPESDRRRRPSASSRTAAAAAAVCAAAIRPSPSSAKHTRLSATTASAGSRERDRGVQAALRPRVHRREVAVIQSVGGQLDLEVRGDYGPRIGDVLERGHEPAVGRLVAAEQVLAHGAAGDQSGAQRTEPVVARGQVQRRRE